MIVIIARFFHLPVCSRILSFCRGALVVIVHQLAREEFIRPDNFILFANAFLKEGGGGVPTSDNGKPLCVFSHR